MRKKTTTIIIAILSIILLTSTIFLAVENNKLKNNKTTLSKLYSENTNKLSLIIEELNKENTDLENQIKKLESNDGQNAKEIQTIKEDKKHLEENNEKLVKDIERLKKENEGLSKKNKDQSKTNDSLTNNTNTQNTENVSNKQKKVSKTKNSLTIKGKNYPIIVGGQNEVNMMGEEFVNVGYYYAQMYEGTGIKNKIHGDGKSIYLAVESKGIGHIIYDTKELEFTDINGDTKTYVLKGLSPTMYSNGKDTQAPDDIWETYAGRSGDLIAIQTCDPDSNDRGKAHAYYFVKK